MLIKNNNLNALLLDKYQVLFTDRFLGETQAEEERLEKEKIEQDKLKKLKTKNAINSFYVEFGREVRSGKCFVFGSQLEFAEKFIEKAAEFISDETNGILNNPNVHKQKIGKLFAQYPDKFDDLKIIFDLVEQELNKKGLEISLDELLENFKKEEFSHDLTTPSEQLVDLTDIPKDVIDEIDSYCENLFAQPTKTPQTSTSLRSRVVFGNIEEARPVKPLNPNAREFKPAR